MGLKEPWDELVDGCHWLGDREGMLACVPELAQAVRPLQAWPIGRSGKQWVWPVTGLDRLSGALVETMERTRASEGDVLSGVQPEAIAGDVLVSQLGTLLQGISERSVSTVVLGVAAMSVSLLSGGPMSSDEPAVARRAQSLVAGMNALDAPEKAKALGRVSDAISARVAAALMLNGLSARGLPRLMIANRLLWVMAHDALDLPLASSIIGSALDEGVVSSVERIAKCALSDAAERLGGRKERGADTLAEAITKSAVGDPLLGRSSGPLLIRLLPHLIDARSLKGRVEAHKLAARLLEPGAIRTLSGAWEELVEPLGVWDCVGAVMAKIVFVERTEGGWRIDSNAIDDTVVWAMSIPRAEPRRVHAVVALRFGNVIAAGGGGAEMRAAVFRRWVTMLGDQQVGCWIGGHGVAVFNRAADALVFAHWVNRNFVGADGMLETKDQPVALPPGVWVAAGVAMGVVVGGDDGDHTLLDGPAVSEALHLCGGSPVVKTQDDPLQIRSVAIGLRGLESSGVSMSRAVMAAALNDWGGLVHRFGDSAEVAGVQRDFQCYPVEGWAEHSQGAMLFFSLGAHRGHGVVELKYVDSAGLRDLCAQDERLQAGELKSEAPATSDEEDPFGFGAQPREDGSPDGSSWGQPGFGDDDGSHG